MIHVFILMILTGKFPENYLCQENIKSGKNSFFVSVNPCRQAFIKREYAASFMDRSFVDSIRYDSPGNKSKHIIGYSLSLHAGFIFAHSQNVQKTRGANPVGIELSRSWQRNDRRSWDLCHCMPQQAITLAYYNYDNGILGESVHLAYSLEPWYKINDKVFFSFLGAAGPSYLTSPYDPVKNPTNMSYSVHWNGYLSLGAGAWFRLSNKWWFNTSFHYQHVSNGGLQLPNKGINWPTAGISISYRPEPSELVSFKQLAGIDWKNTTLRWDVGFFATGKRVPVSNGNSVRFLVAGMTVQAAKRVGKINNLTLGMEANMDNALKQKIQEAGLTCDSWRAGLLVGHEFILGKFLFSQRLGIYMYSPSPYFDRIYHRWGLTMRFNDHWSLGINLMAHRQVADYTDLRLVYSF